MRALNKAIVKFTNLLPENIVYIFAKKYIAGKTLAECVNVVKDLNSKGIMATIDALGEDVTNKEEAIAAKEECLKILDAISENNLNSNLSLKPSQMGIKIDFNLALDHIAEICERAKKYSNFVRIDMEDSSLTDPTIELYKELRKKYDNVGIVVQAYLKRTLNDVVSLRSLNPNFRLCKGIYIEPESVAYQSKKKVRQNFVEILETMLKNGNYVGIATHDDYLIAESYRLIKELNIPKDKYEFQMLYGVKEKLRDKINKDGHRIRIYCPYGEKWHKYSMRRLQENPNIAWHITKSIFFPN